MSVAALELGARPRARPTLRVASVLQLALGFMWVGQLGRIPVLAAGAKDAPLLVNDLLVMTAAAAALVASLRARRLRLDATAILALAFCAVGAGSALAAVPRFGLTAFELMFSLAYLARWMAYFALYVVVLNWVRREDALHVWRTLQGVVVAMAAFGLFQSAFLPDFAFIVHPNARVYTDWDPQGHRLVTTLLDPNYAGGLIGIVLLFALALVSYGVAVPSWQVCVLVAGLGLTVSRGAILSVLIGGLVLVSVRGLSRRFLRAVGLLVLFAIPALPFVVSQALQHQKFGVEASALSRFYSWVRALEVIGDHPIIGVGFNTYGFVQQRVYGGGLANAAFGLDASLLLIAVLTGFVGLAIFLAMVGVVITRCRRAWRDASESPEARGAALGTVAATVTVLVHGFFVNTITYPFILEALWVMWGLSYVMAARGRKAAREARPVLTTLRAGTVRGASLRPLYAR